jgi:single-strand selective monofunctional uracil DNA glycosylase
VIEPRHDPLSGKGATHRRGEHAGSHNGGARRDRGDVSRSGALIEASRELAGRVDALLFGDPVRYVYNPLVYARRPWETYLSRYAGGTKRVVFVGMNPGPWGMAQTGVPFGEVGAVRDWLGIEEPVGRPPREHPKRPVAGFSVERREASGQRLWGLMRRRFETPAAFFAEHFVANYCPLLFLDAEGRNLTPDKLRADDRDELFRHCDDHLRRVVEVLEPEWLIGIGRFTEGRIRELYGSPKGGASAPRRSPSDRAPPRLGGVLHPSPASPQANRDWAGAVTARLIALGIW